MNKIIRSLITISLFMSVAVSQVEADVVPAGLLPGDHYQLAFVTSTTRNATSADISDYNTFVNAAANLPGSLVSGATFYAIASTPTVNANSNAVMSISTNFKGVYNLNGFKIADNIYSGSLQALLNYDETGKQTSFNRAWTGSIAEGVSYIAVSQSLIQ